MTQSKWTWTDEEIDAVKPSINPDLVATDFAVSEDGKVIIFTTASNTLVTVPISLVKEFEGVHSVEDCNDWVLNSSAGVLWMDSDPDSDNDPLLVYNILRGLYSSKKWMTTHPEKITTRNEYLYFSQTMGKLPIDDPTYPDQEWLKAHKSRIEELMDNYAKACALALGYA